jgi:hypothetical protein
MSEFPSARFFQTNLDVVFPDTKFSVDALVSPFGICRLVFPIGLKLSSARAKASFEDFSCDILLIKQFTETGTFYSARFEGLTPEQSNYLKKRVEAQGAPPTWVRRFPRIAVATLNEETNPHPSFCLFSWQGKDHKFRVVNFTVDGLRLTFSGEMPGLRVGTILTINVYTSAGSGISGLDAEVKNFCVHDSGSGQAVTELGLRFNDSRSVANESYRNLIRECVISLRGRNP